jgi:hypothetical protein
MYYFNLCQPSRHGWRQFYLHPYHNISFSALCMWLGPRGTFVGELGSTHSIGVNFLSNTICHAVWCNLKGVFPARDAIYDANYIILFWLVKPDGFNLSLDITPGLRGLIGITKEEYYIKCMMVSRCAWNVLLRYFKGWRFMHFVFG